MNEEFFMVYICGDCQFLFERTDEPERCVDCGSENIKKTDNAEQQEFERIKAEHKR